MLTKPSFVKGPVRFVDCNGWAGSRLGARMTSLHTRGPDRTGPSCQVRKPFECQRVGCERKHNPIPRRGPSLDAPSQAPRRGVVGGKKKEAMTRSRCASTSTRGLGEKRQEACVTARCGVHTFCNGR